MSKQNKCHLEAKSRNIILERNHIKISNNNNNNNTSFLLIVDPDSILLKKSVTPANGKIIFVLSTKTKRYVTKHDQQKC